MASGAAPADLRQGLLYPQHSADLMGSAPEPWVLISPIPPVMCAPESVLLSVCLPCHLQNEGSGCHVDRNGWFMLQQAKSGDGQNGGAMDRKSSKAPLGWNTGMSSLVETSRCSEMALFLLLS